MSPAGSATLRDRLAREIGAPAAVGWIHSLAVVRHAVQAGMLADALTSSDAPAVVVERAVRVLADSHPALAGFGDPAVNRAWTRQLADPAAAELLAWARGADFLPEPHRPDGYAIGDLYQALSDEARKGRALCQTPRFVTRLLLDLGLTPAAEEYGWNGLRMIDPACGTGHILVETLLRVWSARQSGRSDRGRPRPCGEETPLQQVRAALGSVHGVDLDPYAALVARYRLAVLAACILHNRPSAQAQAHGGLCGLPRDLPLQVAAADSLLDDDEPLLARGRYHAVIANPPYITCKDPVQRDAIRARWRQVCSGKFSLAVPFEPLMHAIAVPGGWVARITANSFMKREFGKPLVEKFFPTVDLQWIIDTSGAYIPGHGTPTVILASRAQLPSSPTLNGVLGKRGEPSASADPARGLVWTAIRTAVHERMAFARLAAACGAPPETPQAPASPPIPAQRQVYVQPSLLDLMAAAQ